MNDKALNILIRSTMLAGIGLNGDLAAFGVEVKRAFQQTQQGADSAPCVYFFKVGDHRQGHPAKLDKLDASGQAFVHTEVQLYETTYQCMARVPQDPDNITELTESDVLNTVSGIMQSDSTLAIFKASGVGIMRITDVRNPYIVDDQDTFAASPSFDVIFSHKRKTVSTTPAVTTYDAKISRV